MNWREKLLVFGIFFLGFSFFSSFKTTVQIPDEEYVIRVAQNITEGKSLNLPDYPPYKHPGTTEIGRDGKRYSTYPIGQSIIFAPFYYVSKKLNVLFSPYRGESNEDLQTWANRVESETTRYLYIVPALFSALSCFIFYIFCFALGARRIACIVTTTIFAFCTMVWPYSKFLLSESSQAFFLIATVYFLFMQKSENRFKAFPMALAGLCFGLLCIVKPTFLILGAAFAVYWLYKPFNKKDLIVSVGIFMLIFLAIFSLQLIYNYIRFNSSTNFGYIKAGFFTPFYVGIYGFIFSSGKGFFFYSPIAVLFFLTVKRLFREQRELAFLFIAIIVIMTTVYASWNVWSGDLTWGPRFLVPLIPFFMLPAVYFMDDIYATGKKIKIAFVAMLVLASLFVQVPAVAVHYLYYLNYFKSYVSPIPAPNITVNFRGQTGQIAIRDPYIDFQFIPEFSPILGQWWVLENLIFPGPKSMEDTPWEGLGFNKFHKNRPLNAQFDLWVVNLVKDSIKTGRFGNLFYPIIMICLIPMVILYYVFDVKIHRGFHTTKDQRYRLS